MIEEKPGAILNPSSSNLPPLVTDLLKPEQYPHNPKNITLVQTHISYVFIADTYVYKIKKPVNFGFLDFSSQEKRRYFCEEENRLNRRTSKDIYLKVVDISEKNGRYFPEDSSNPVEAAVKMRRLPDELMFYNLILVNRVTDEMLSRIAGTIADFHLNAETSEDISRYGGFDLIQSHSIENFEQIKPYIGKTIELGLYKSLLAQTTKFITENKKKFLSRVENGCIRDCHGDLRPKHIFVSDRIDIIDCIEFNQSYRLQDTASDIAFLTMELDYMRRSDLSITILNDYLSYTADYDMVSVINFYKTYRAIVRGKVASMTASDKSIPTEARQEAAGQAKKFFHLAENYTRKKEIEKKHLTLVITCGLSGSGKSRAAGKLAKEIGAIVIRSDSVRKSLAGLQVTKHYKYGFEEGIYSNKDSERTYKRMLDQAKKALMAGWPVILDATFGKRRFRDDARALSQKTGVQFRILWCEAPIAVLRERLSKRLTSPGKLSHEPSDAGPEILELQARGFEPLNDEEKKFT